MPRLLTAPGLALLASAIVALTLAPSAPARSLLTRWAPAVSPTHPRPDYPRPDAVRREWRSLNGPWQFAQDDHNLGLREGWGGGRRALPGRILVPFTFEAPLSGLGDPRQASIHERVWYRRSFTVPRTWGSRRVLLHFGAVDWQSTVWVNGHRLGVHRGSYGAFTYDVTRALKPGARQEVVVAAYAPVYPTRGGYQPRGKQWRGRNERHRWYARTTGIWQSVWLEPVAARHVDSLALRPDLDGGRLGIDAALAGRGSATLRATVSLRGRVVATGSAPATDSAGSLSLPVASPEPWAPEHPTLYDVAVALEQGGRVVDRVGSYTAFRTIGTQGGRITLNGRPYFMRGALDQGFWPDGNYTAPSDAALRDDVVQAKAMGFNLLRKHVKVEDPRYYYWADRLGLLVAQDMPASFNLTTPVARAQFAAEWRDELRSLAGHPSVAFWIAFNENWGRPGGAFQDAIVRTAHRIDPTRPVVDASDSIRRPSGDIVDYHAYGTRPARQIAPGATKPQWVGEFGGLEVPVAGHLWTNVPDSNLGAEDLLASYRALTQQLSDPALKLSGFDYTQLYDVEREVNGLETYDRVPKVAPGRVAEVNLEAQRRSEQPASTP